MRQGFRVAAGGVALGLVGAWWATQGISALLFGVQPRDPATFAVVGVLLLVTLLARYVPPRRTTQVNPAAALRCD